MHGDVDYDRAWLKLKAYIQERRSHGQDGLFAAMARIELECSDEEARDSRASSPDAPLDEEAATRPSPPMRETDKPTRSRGGTNGYQHHRAGAVG